MISKEKKGTDKKVYKSLYDVKNKYLPHADLEFLERKDDDITQEAFIQALRKITRPTQTQSCDNK